MKAVVLGMGKSGKAALGLLQSEGWAALGVDSNPSLGFASTACLEGVDLLVVSPGIARTHPLYIEAKEKGIPIKGEAGLALERLKEHFVVGVTGSNGKTTLVSFLEHALKLSGKKGRALGNIGAPLADYAKARVEGEILIVELSSYQLETLGEGVLNCGTILNITPNHHDRYLDFNEYAETKWKMATCLKEGGALYVPVELKREGAFVAEDIPRALCLEMGLSGEEIEKARETFIKPPHRIEYVCEVGGVACYNDSKSTTLEATLYALKQVGKKVVLIAGGKPKSPDFTPWIQPFQGVVEAVIAIGEAAPFLVDQLKTFPIEEAYSVQEAVAKALEKAAPGMAVLLSPGCSSFDWFKNYEERGDQFRAAFKGAIHPSSL